MSIWVEIVCDGCAEHGPGEHVREGRYPAKKLRDEAKRQGWHVEYSDTGWPLHLCPKCRVRGT